MGKVNSVTTCNGDLRFLHCYKIVNGLLWSKMDSPAWGTELLGREPLFINCHEAIKGWTAQEAIMQLKSHFCVIKYVGKGGKSPIKYWGNTVIKLIRFSQKSRHFNHIIFTMNGNLEQKLLILVGRKRVHLRVSACRRQRNSQNTASIYWPFFHLGWFSWKSQFVKSLKSAIATQCGSRSELGDGLFPDNGLFPYM